MKRKILALLFLCLSAGAIAQSNKASHDGFGRLRVGEGQSLFDGQFTYDRQPLLFDTITVGSGTAVAHDTTNRDISITFASVPSGAISGVQSFDFFRYQPGKSQLIFITFNFTEAKTGVRKIVGYSDGTNGIELMLDGRTPKFVIRSGTGEGTTIVSQSDWNLDRLDGKGASRLSVDFTKTQILVIDIQALYVGRVRVGFDIGGTVWYAHQFTHANESTYPYIQTANLPIRAVMESTDTATTSMAFVCTSVISEAGADENYAYQFVTDTTVTAANGTDTHLFSIEPAVTFNGIPNRTKFRLSSLKLTNTGNNNVEYKIVLGQALTSPVATLPNSVFSAAQRKTRGTLSGTAAIVVDKGVILSGTGGSDVFVTIPAELKYPITLDHEGNQRDLGRVTILVKGIGGTAPVQGILVWEEIR